MDNSPIHMEYISPVRSYEYVERAERRSVVALGVCHRLRDVRKDTIGNDCHSSGNSTPHNTCSMMVKSHTSEQ